MAEDWIKMRVGISRDPQISRMVDHYLEHFCHADVTRDRALRVTLRCAFVGALVSVWGIARKQGVRVENDLILDGATLSTLDDLADLHGFGESMSKSDWLIQSKKGLVFPRFFEEYNEDFSEAKARAKERQARHRERARNARRNAHVTRTKSAACAQEVEVEKEIDLNTKNPLSPPSDSIEETPDLDQPSPDSKSRDSPPPTIPFVPVTDDPTDWLVVEAEFIAWWNKIPGVVKCNKNALPSNLVMEFRERWRDPGWWSSAQACAKKFPLQGHVTMALRKFLVETTVDEILGGVFDGLPDRKAKQPADKRGQDAVDQARADLREWAESALGDRSA